jgi:SH3 domain protein
LFVVVQPCLAATSYVTDRLVVSLRERPQDNAEVITYLKTDDALELLEDLGEFAKVQTPTGEVGYVQQQYLTDAPPKIETIQRLQNKSDHLAARVKDLEERAAMSTSQIEQDRQRLSTELQVVREEAAELQKQFEQSQAELNKVSKDYQTLLRDSENVLAMSTERDHLQQESQELQTRLADIEEDRDALLKKGAIKWFLTGSGVLLLGWIIGKMSGSRRRSSLL